VTTNNIELQFIGKQLLAIQREQRQLHVENELITHQIGGITRVLLDQIIASEERMTAQMTEVFKLVETLAARLPEAPS
jgi:hypothetical protein